MGKKKHHTALQQTRRVAKELGAFNDELTNVVDRGVYANIETEEHDFDVVRDEVDFGRRERETSPAKARVGPARPKHCAKKAHADLSLDEQALCIRVAQHFNVAYDLVMRMFKLVFGPYLRNHRALWPSKGRLKPHTAFPRLRTTPHLTEELVIHGFTTYLDSTWVQLPGIWVSKQHTAMAGSKIINRKELSAWLSISLPLSARGMRAVENGLPPPIVEYGHALGKGAHSYHVHAYFIGERKPGATVTVNGMRCHPESRVGEHFAKLWVVEDLRLYDGEGERYTRLLPEIEMGWVAGCLRRPRVRLALNGANGEHTGKDDVHWQYLLWKRKLLEHLALNPDFLRPWSERFFAVCPACCFVFAYQDDCCVYFTPMGLYTNEVSPQHVRLVFPWMCANCRQPVCASQLNGVNGEATNKDDVKGNRSNAELKRMHKEAKNKLHQKKVPNRNDPDDHSERESGESVHSEESSLSVPDVNVYDTIGALNEAIMAVNAGDMRHKSQVLAIAKRVAEWRLTHHTRDEQQERDLAKLEAELMAKMRLADAEHDHRKESVKEEREFRRLMNDLEHRQKGELNKMEHDVRKAVVGIETKSRVEVAKVGKDAALGAATLDKDARVEAARLQAEGNVRANVARNENPLAIALGKVLAMGEDEQIEKATHVRKVMDVLEGKLEVEKAQYHFHTPVVPLGFDPFPLVVPAEPGEFLSQLPDNDNGFIRKLPADLRAVIPDPPRGQLLVTKAVRNAYMETRVTNKDGTVSIPRWSYSASHPDGVMKVNFSDCGYSVLHYGSGDNADDLIAPPRFFQSDESPTVWPVKHADDPFIGSLFSVPNVLAPVLLRSTDARTLGQKLYGKLRNVFATKDRSYHIMEMGECDNVTAFLDSMAVNRKDVHLLDGYACLGMGREWFHAAAMKFQDFLTWGGYTHCRHVPVSPLFMDWFMNHYDAERDLASCIWHNHVNWKTTFAQVTSEIMNIVKGCLPFNCIYAHAVAITQAMVIRYFVGTQLAGKATEAK